MSRPTWETQRRVKPDIWRGNGSNRTEEEGSSNSFHVERRSHPASLSVESLQDISSSTSDIDDQPGAYAISRDGVDPLTLDWDESDSLGTRGSQRKPVEDSTRDGIMPFFIADKENNSKMDQPFCCGKTKKECKWLFVLALVASLTVIIFVAVFLTSLRMKTKNGTTPLDPVDKCDFSTIPLTTQIDPILQCECHDNVELILDVVVSSYEEIRNAAFITFEIPDIHSCTVENMALLWAASEFSISKESSSNNQSMEAFINRWALSIMFLSWGGKDWTNKANWMKPDSECVWFGVTCDNEKRVVAVELSNNNLHGVLGTQLGLIRSLAKIDLSINQLRGTINENWWNLDKLGAYSVSYSLILPNIY
jgi:hypothetical protein